ncbi:substrate-binding domain-containing protein [Streptomyces sp. HNM0575]|uniref:LacI family DNA-binding transcriptional regulator n=1 Tax=Streptomyces sp. HNM0575 TaxID=2716338 RepID=UPI00145F80D4|nr:LacI family DNA-binding transcriptional regulator [Streptomyces sp. HNM0575]NLU76201.1 substrate-binding domain-containing protein [Streptomyces sp. HNM0575]
MPPSPSRVTQADVARHAGVSRTTVSFVLSGREDTRISIEARQRILGAAEELGYRPNLTAQSLRTRKTYTVGLVSDIVASTHYAGEMIQGALEAALERDHLLYFAESGDDPDAERKLLQGMLDRQVDGLIHAAMSTRARRVPEQLRSQPSVLLNCLDESGEFASVVPDEEAAGRQAAKLLLEAGHREGIHVVGGRCVTRGAPDGVYAGRERMRGIEAALAEAGVRLSGVSECDWSAPRFGYGAARRLLEAGPRPTAVVCCNDRLAFGVYQAAAEQGLSVPHDLSVVAFDDSELASWLRPALTSVALPHREMGRRAVSLLLSPEEPEPSVHRIPMPVRRRDSIAVPHR